MTGSFAADAIDPPSADTAGRRDFPFYSGWPQRLSGRQWILIILAWLAATTCDLFVALPGPAWLSVAVRGLLFAGIPLLAIAAALPGGIGSAYLSLFSRIRGRDVGMMAIFAAINVIVTFLVGLLVQQIIGVGASNPVNGALASMNAGAVVLFYLGSILQLIGEEMFTVIPFLATLTLGGAVFRLPRRSAIAVAVIVSAVLFALIHLPTYNWHLIQVLLIIGVARVILLIPYLLTKNLWVSAGAHVLNDWTLFTLVLLGATITR